MGNDPLKSKQSIYHWQRVTNHNGVQIYKRVEDAKLAEKRSIYLDSTYNFDTEESIYGYRKNNDQGLVRVYQVEFLQENVNPKKKKQPMSDMCKCTENMNINVFSERIEYRLGELPQLTFAESLQFLKQTLLSFEVIYHKMGPLHINAELIGINDLGEIKVWVNQNWALNHPSHLINTLKSTNARPEEYDMVPPQLRDESQMIKNLVNVIQSKTQQGRFPNDFGEQIRQKTSSFREARKFMNHFITQQFKNYIPNIIKRSRVAISKDQSKLLQNTMSTGLPYQNHSNDFQKTINAGYVQPPINNFALNSFNHNNNVSHTVLSTTNIKTNSLSSNPINIKINPPPLNTINFKTNSLPYNNINLKASSAPSNSISTFNFNDFKQASQSSNKVNANFYFGKQKQPAAVIPLDSTSHVHVDINGYNSSLSKSFLDPLPSYNTNFSSSPLAFKQFYPNFTNYTSTYKPYSPHPLYGEKITTSGSETSKLFPELKFNLLGNNDTNYRSALTNFPINNTAASQQVKSSFETPVSPLHSLNSLLGKDFGQEHQATYKINPQIELSTNQNPLINEPVQLTTFQT